ncbi:hypothetical protein ILUMI_06185 [Ignelater luminosus]|uniref:Essential protein Yae1 N-terminal domain-containing protein n=1 Tax=Ignelater luminosus TaxID=2038154 RepID=A0A8K0DBK1_IGNLU|nr:hypothetical protein ILUMI_06185 [Ignelater luminosus]
MYQSKYFAADAQDKDINDIFSDLLLSEEHLSKEGYDEGYTKGASEGNIEGYHLGYHRGAEIGAELGYYCGVVENLLMLHKENADPRIEKNKKHLETLKTLIESFPKHNSEEVDILALADNIRTLFKKVCALFKIDAAYPEADKLSF